jgi:hypothetical protein
VKTYRTISLAVIVPLLLVSYSSIANAQSLVPGIHGMSVVDGVKFTWVIISSDTDISINLRYAGQRTSPPVTVVATALTNPSVTSGAPSTMAGSQSMNAGWTSPTSVTIRLEGGSTLYDADLVTVVASPYGSAIQPNATSTTNSEVSTPSTTNEPSISNSPTSSEPPTGSQTSTPVIPSDESSSSTDSKQSSDNEANSNGSNCDPSYPDFCIPSPPPDLNCADISQKRFTVSGSDPHGFDRDNDGVGCES